MLRVFDALIGAMKAFLGALRDVPCALLALRKTFKAVLRAGTAVLGAMDLCIQSCEAVLRAFTAMLVQ